MIIDSHQHYWTLARSDYAWLTERAGSIFRDFGPEDLSPHLESCSVGRTVVVQATDTVEETRFLLEMSDRHKTIAAVVGWLDMHDADMPRLLADIATHPKLRGVRPMLQSIDRTDWILDERAAPSLKQLEHFGLSFDALIQPRHLPVIADLADRLRDLPIVINHMAKPKMKKNRAPDQLWCDGMSDCAQRDNVFVKLSGMMTLFEGPVDRRAIYAHIDHVMGCFGPQRVMFGSDWPVSNLACDYSEWFAIVQDYIAPMSEAEQVAILGATAAKFYKLGDAFR